ncbi:carbohydrate ABC transporter permease [Paenibacillus montanisoli]|uniref:Carbohydrate ABC transporter permease n=1 Tax=Paenibacillus montanisoli TaxID=2081970 RepID=A0A328TWW7_9BACL|nr:carbohydrate ABC transporter permease [Paenibacillus montanisoli]RAP74063.1 carbohydrate ABC transporter permease [Paenibacillus montanisoli]
MNTYSSVKTSLFIHRIMVYSLLIAGSVLFILPLLWMLSTSLKGDVGLFDLPPKWVPEPFQWDNYVKAVQSFPFLRYTYNTLFLTFVSMFGTVLSSSLVAYAFAKLRWPGRNVWFVILLATMMLPPQVTMIPVFVLFKKLNWIDTYLPLTVPYFFGGAFYIFLLRQFFMTIPKELSEAAKIDGCKEIMIYAKIFLPLSKPALATLAIFTFMGTWNDFLGPLIYLNDPDKFTLALGLRSFQMQYGTRWNVMMAASIIVMLPTIVLFLSCQKYFIEGITLTGIKG